MAEDPPSMRDFDYFDDAKKPVGLEDVESLFEEDSVPSGLEAQVLEFRRQRSRRVRALVLTLVFFGASAWLLVGYRDRIDYALRPPSRPVALGDIVTADRSRLVHNTFVALEGVTMHRGLKQKMISQNLYPEEFHYFELSGGQGVFIEVAPERGIQFATSVSVAGRVIDPKRESGYTPLLREYQKRYYQERRPGERIIQVGVEPGSGRLLVLVVLGLLGAVGLLNIWTLVRLVLHQRRRPV